MESDDGDDGDEVINDEVVNEIQDDGERTGYIIAIILGVVIVAIIVILIIILSIYLTNRLNGRPVVTTRTGKVTVQPNTRVVIPEHSIDGLTGMSHHQYNHVGNGLGIVNCGIDGRSELKDGKCVCTGTYWGINCQLESYNHNFTAVGKLDQPLLGDLQVDVDTFSQCQQTCLEMDSCAAFQWRDNECVIVESTPVVTIDNGPHYDPTVQSELYLKNSHLDRPLFDDVVFLYYNQLPRRFWQGNRDNVIPVVPGYAYHLPFIPENWINDNRYDLAFSDRQFDDVRQAKVIVRGDRPFVPTAYNWVMIVNGGATVNQRPYWCNNYPDDSSSIDY